jgi:hypothetical protein
MILIDDSINRSALAVLLAPHRVSAPFVLKHYLHLLQINCAVQIRGFLDRERRG